MSLRVRTFVVAIASALVISACAGGGPVTSTGAQACPDAKDPIKIGVFEPLTGALAYGGVPQANAIKMYVEALNAAGGISGRPVVLDLQDERGDPKEAANLAQKFASDSSIIAAIGPLASTSALAAAPIFTQAKMLLFAPNSSHPDLTKNTSYVFRGVNTQAQLAQPFADFLATKLKAKRLAIIVATDEFSKSNAALTSAYLKDKYKDVEIVLTESVTADTRDFRPLLTKLQNLKPDVVWIIAFPAESAAFVTQLKQSGQKYVLHGGTNLAIPTFLELAGAAAEGIYFHGFFHPTDPRPAAKAFVADYEKKYGAQPDQWAAFGDDAIVVVTLAIKTSLASGQCLSRQGVVDAMRQIPPYEGLTGVKKFIPGSGDIEPAKMSDLIAQGGKFRVLGPNEP